MNKNDLSASSPIPADLQQIQDQQQQQQEADQQQQQMLEDDYLLQQQFSQYELMLAPSD